MIFSIRLLLIDLPLIMVSLYLLISTAFATLYFSYPDNSSITKMMIVTPIVLFGIIGINYFLYKLSQKHGTDKAISILASSIVASSILPIFIGFIQVPGELLGLHEVNQVITSIFSYRYTPGRIHLLSGEPSWAARYILFVIVISFFVNARSIGHIRAALYVLLFFTGSALGFFSGLLLLIAFKLTHSAMTIGAIAKSSFVLFSLLLAFVNYDILLSFSPYAIDKIDRVFLLLSNLSLEHIMTIASIDGSVLARIVNPIISIDLALSYPFGVGGESFRYWVLEKIQQYGYAGSSSDEYILGSGSTPKLLIAKIAVEHGLLFLIALSVLFARLYNGMKTPRLKFLLLSVPIMTVSDDSYLFYGLILPICIAFLAYRNRRAILVQKNNFVF